MHEVKWTRGFCLNCGRYIRHFRRRECPECGQLVAIPPGVGIRLSGLDYILAITLGAVTNTRWTPYRVFERVLFRLGHTTPRRTEEIYVSCAIVTEFLILVVVSFWRIGTSSICGLIFAVALAWRVTELIATRLRIVLYDRVSPSWRHGTYSRSAIMLFLNIGELIVVFAIGYQLITVGHCDSLAEWNQALMYSWGRFFSVDVLYPAYVCEDTQIALHEMAVLQLTCEFALIVFAMSSLINMLSKGRESSSS